MTSFDRVVRLEKFPYLLTLLFVLLGWGLTHTVDRLLDSPLIEYTVKQEAKEGSVNIEYQITNITRDKLFKGLSFLVMLPDTPKARIVKASWAVLPPIRLDPSAKEPDTNAMRAIYYVPQFHPNCSIRLQVLISGSVVPPLRFSSSDTAVMLIHSSLQTFLVRNEICILVILMATWSIAILAYGIYLGRAVTTVVKEQAQQEKSS
jgi:hypothetical protein